MAEKRQFNVRLLPTTIERIERFERLSQSHSRAEAIDRALCIALAVISDEEGPGVLSALGRHKALNRGEEVASTPGETP